MHQPDPARTLGTAEVGRLYADHAAAVQRTCRRYVPDAIAEELTSEAFLRLLTTRTELRDPTAAGAWLHTTAQRLCLDHLKSAAARREEARPTEELPEDAERTITLEEQVEPVLLAERLTGSVRPADAQLLHDRYIADRSTADIAAARSVTLASVKVLLHRSRARARQVGRDLGLGGILTPVAEWVQRWSGKVQQLGHHPEWVVAALAPLLLIGGLSAVRNQPLPVHVQPPGAAAVRGADEAVSDAGTSGPADAPETGREGGPTAPTGPQRPETGPGPDGDGTGTEAHNEPELSLADPITGGATTIDTDESLDEEDSVSLLPGVFETAGAPVGLEENPQDEPGSMDRYCDAADRVPDAIAECRRGSGD